jgi:hypothetical protein
LYGVLRTTSGAMYGTEPHWPVKLYRRHCSTRPASQEPGTWLVQSRRPWHDPGHQIQCFEVSNHWLYKDDERMSAHPAPGEELMGARTSIRLKRLTVLLDDMHEASE